MKNESLRYITNLLLNLDKIKSILQTLSNEAQEKCIHYHYDNEAFEQNCDIVPEMESVETCLKCNNFEFQKGQIEIQKKLNLLSNSKGEKQT